MLEALQSYWGLLRLSCTGPPSPTTDGQWQGNDRTHEQGAQAGGFWRSCRQWRKDS